MTLLAIEQPFFEKHIPQFFQKNTSETIDNFFKFEVLKFQKQGEKRKCTHSRKF